MGHKRRLAGKRSGVDRRHFLKSAAAGLAASALPLLPEGGNAAHAAGALSFVHGVASGDPLNDRVILWTRVTTPGTAPCAVSYVVATDPALTALVQTGTFITDASRDYTVKLDVGGLEPGRTYYYRFNVGNVTSPIGRTKTLPTGNVDRLRVAVASCSSLAHGFFNAYARIAERTDLDFVLHLGDYIYEYGNGDYGNARTYEPAHEILTLADYRQRHGQYKREPELQELHRSIRSSRSGTTTSSRTMPGSAAPRTISPIPKATGRPALRSRCRRTTSGCRRACRTPTTCGATTARSRSAISPTCSCWKNVSARAPSSCR